MTCLFFCPVASTFVLMRIIIMQFKRHPGRGGVSAMSVSLNSATVVSEAVPVVPSIRLLSCALELNTVYFIIHLTRTPLLRGSRIDSL